MGILANENAIQTGGYNIANSLRFQSASTQSLNRTPAVSNRKTFTMSMWVKRGSLSSIQGLFQGYIDTNNAFRLDFDSANTLFMGNTVSGVSTIITTNAVFRDPSAWYHIVAVVDTTQATASEREKIYVNNVLQTVTGSYVSQNTDVLYNYNITHYLGNDNTAAGRSFDGYMAEVNFIDGQALPPSSFGETNTLTGQWVAKKYNGTYGTNGFYLPFSNGTSTTTLGADSSGNGNNWTLTNFTRSAGVSDCWMYDVPSGNGGVAGTQPNSNYADINPLIKGSYSVVSNANLKVTGSTGNSYNSVMSTIGMSSGKWYCEVTATSVGGSPAIGICLNTQTLGAGGATAGYVGDASGGYSYFTDGSKFHNATQTTGYGSTWTTGDVIGVAFDADAGSITFYKNNVSQGVAYSSISMTQPWFFGVSTYLTTDTFNINFGQRSFAYTPPSGFKALCTANLPASTIVKGNQYMDATIWSGNSTNPRSITGLNFSPDLLWVKSRSTASQNEVVDSVRGATGSVMNTLFTDLTAAEGTSNSNTYLTYGLIKSLDSSGFTLDTGTTNANQVNTTGQTYVGWSWDAGSSTVTNTSGTISSQVRANPTAGVSVATFTATSGNYSVGHGLGIAPSMTMVKRRDSSTGGSWWTWHIGIGNNTTDYLELNSTAAEGSVANMWGTVGRNSTVCGFNGTASTVAGGTFVMYNFAEIAGFSKFGSYTGNGSADGPFIFTGFRPKFVMVKRTDGIGHWVIKDTSRNPYNVADANLYADLSNAEDTTSTVYFDLLSNGFKLRGTYAYTNASGGSYIYMAFAENPFAQANAR